MARLSTKSDTTAAILYALNRWAALTRDCDDGTLEIDNSAAERALRGVALGRRNYLFAVANSSGERVTAIYTLVGTAKLNGIDPEAYLRHVLGCIAEHPINRVEDRYHPSPALRRHRQGLRRGHVYRRSECPSASANSTAPSLNNPFPPQDGAEATLTPESGFHPHRGAPDLRHREY